MRNMKKAAVLWLHIMATMWNVTCVVPTLIKDLCEHKRVVC